MKNMNLTPQSQKRTTVAQLANVPDNTRSSAYWRTTSIKVDPEQWKKGESVRRSNGISPCRNLSIKH